ncbi:MAG: hypothetical protein E7414_01025 [Ruminococcaceae bacterium]|nr:hypothetical protein [Oscillospiraceae bacterium]
MKKIILIVLTLILVFALAACGASTINDENVKVASVDNTDDGVTAVNNNIEWKEFLKEYETWVDKYIEITKKSKANPSDMSILSDYTEMMKELTDWSTKAEDMEKALKDASSAELAEYSAELARIAAKIAQAAF